MLFVLKIGVICSDWWVLRRFCDCFIVCFATNCEFRLFTDRNGKS